MTINSMTGFGHGIYESKTHRYQCEVKSVNSRFLETNIRLPRRLMAAETFLTAMVKKQLARGKVDVFVEIQHLQPAASLPNLNLNAADHYLQTVSELNDNIKVNQPFTLSCYELFQLEGALGERAEASPLEDRLTQHRDGLEAALNQALARLKEARATEGSALKQALSELVFDLSNARTQVRSQIVQIRDELTRGYAERMAHLAKELEDKGVINSKELAHDRITTELTIYADKIDVAEELTRLEAHEKDFLSHMERREPVGRKLDFICQEMHREVNTMGNKVVHLDIARKSLDMKQAIERLKQQVQNIE